MIRTAIAVAGVLITQSAALAILFGARQELPPQVASHFNAAGVPDGWMSRTSYLWTMAGIELGMAVFIVGVFYGMRYFPSSAINLPHREYWLATDRRDETFGIMFRAGAWLASLMAVLFCGVHLLVVAANQSQPVRLSPAVWALLGGFLAATLVWAVCFIWRFRRHA